MLRLTFECIALINVLTYFVFVTINTNIYIYIYIYISLYYRDHLVISNTIFLEKKLVLLIMITQPTSENTLMVKSH